MYIVTVHTCTCIHVHTRQLNTCIIILTSGMSVLMCISTIVGCRTK